MTLTPAEIEQFQQDGFLIKRQMIDMSLLNEIRSQTKTHLNLRLPPFELEAELGYPKAPRSTEAVGGQTIRRLLLAYTRDQAFREWAKNRVVKSILQQLLDSDEIFFVQSHHNCVMTKQPEYSSKTLWHRDVRYWRFNNHELINSWLAMGQENNDNGCLKVIPGSHLLKESSDMVDDALFLKVDHPQSEQWLTKAIDVELQAGDVLFFHAAIFHAANHNRTDTPKYSLVNSYHGVGTQAIKGTKSTCYEEVMI
ncbi:MAG: phytanoyl-CoA dioxygenase family protein [Xanthomonadales bacterium]|nr:phytanoyl-CoA dioxygenase family protein [Xanthomonadales bacterium]